jgi:3-oxoacyl-[acyl-carrier protein] reductase
MSTDPNQRNVPRAGLLAGRKAVVTGSSRGIGRAIAIRFAEQGADVVINYVKGRAEAEAVADIVRGLGRQAVVVEGSVAEAQAARRVVYAAAEQFGRLDILVNNAGITRDGFLMLMKEADWDEVMAVNLKSVFHCCKHACRLMVSQRSGCIINIGSLSGFLGMKGQVNYAAAKLGMVGASRSLAQELGKFNIRVNMIAPGWIKTRITDNVDADVIGRHPILLGRLGLPEEVADCAVFLASDMSSYMTAAVLHVNGGIQSDM